MHIFLAPWYLAANVRLWQHYMLSKRFTAANLLTFCKFSVQKVKCFGINLVTKHVSAPSWAIYPLTIVKFLPISLRHMLVHCEAHWVSKWLVFYVSNYDMLRRKISVKTCSSWQIGCHGKSKCINSIVHVFCETDCQFYYRDKPLEVFIFLWIRKLK